MSTCSLSHSRARLHRFVALLALAALALALASALTSARAQGTPSGDYGEVAIGSSVTGSIAAAVDGISYHTYRIRVPPGSEGVAIGLSGEGSDADVAIRRGAPIDSYDATDVTDFSLSLNPVHTLDVQGIEVVYVDVVNLSESAYDYVLFVAPSLEVIEGGDLTESGESGQVGDLDIGESVEGFLRPLDDVAAYHSYTVVVPTGTSSLTIALSSPVDIDLAAKYGSTIADYDESETDYLDQELSGEARFEISSPQAGIWFIDVHTSFDEGSYTLTVR